MPTIPPKVERTYEVAPEGTHVARIVQFIHQGTSPNLWKGEERDRNTIRYVFELPHETYEYEGVKKPHLLSAEYTLSLSTKANLRKVVESLEGRKLSEEEEYTYDVESLVGRECMVQVQHTESNGKTYANIVNVMPVLKGTVCPAQITPKLVFNFYPFSKELFDSLPEYIRKKIEKSVEYRSALILRGDLPATADPKKKEDTTIDYGDFDSGETQNPDDIPF